MNKLKYIKKGSQSDTSTINVGIVKGLLIVKNDATGGAAIFACQYGGVEKIYGADAYTASVDGQTSTIVLTIGSGISPYTTHYIIIGFDD